jgi:serine/threonine protein kinase
VVGDSCIPQCTISIVVRLEVSAFPVLTISLVFLKCSDFKHPNIIRLLGYTVVGVDQGADLCIVYEMGSRGSLGSNLRDDNKAKLLTWRDRVRVACGLASALNYLHCLQPGNPVYHRDVKSDNVWNPSPFLSSVFSSAP